VAEATTVPLGENQKVHNRYHHSRPVGLALGEAYCALVSTLTGNSPKILLNISCSLPSIIYQVTAFESTALTTRAQITTESEIFLVTIIGLSTPVLKLTQFLTLWVTHTLSVVSKAAGT
jgi:hypothetical protein